MNNGLDAIKTGNKKFPVFNFGCDLMNLKFLIVLTMVICALCVIPVNAEIISKIPNIDNLGINPTYNELAVTYSDQEHFLFIWKDLELILSTETDYNNPYVYYSNDLYTDYIRLQKLINDYGAGYYEIEYDIFHEEFGKLWNFTVSSGNDDYDIIIENDNNTIELGTINNYNQVFTIGSNQNGIVKNITSYSAYNCYIENLQPNYVILILDSDLTSGKIEFSGNVDYNGVISQFETTAIINYNYIPPILPTNEIPFEIEFIDYDKGLQLIGANLTVYYYDESSNTLTETYRNSNCNGLERITVRNNSVLFLEYNLNGYNAVNIDTYEFLNNRQGKLIDSNLRSARLYFSKIDPSVLVFQGFIIKDSFGNALSGVSVTMDNNQTVISNQYGGVRFDNINQGAHTFVFSKTGYYSQSLSKSVSVSNTQNILLVSSQPTTAPTVKPTPLQTDSQGNIIIEKPSNLSDSIKYGLAKIFGITSIDSINLIFALILILFPAVIGGTITNQALGFISGGMIGFVFALAVGLIPIWVFFSMVMFAVIYLILTHSNDGF